MKRHRFSYTMLKSPAGYISFHGALNQLGNARFPDQWGSTPEWALLPFFSRLGDYGRHVFELDRYSWKPVRISSDALPDAEQANRLFSRVANELIDVLSQQVVAAYLITDGDLPEAIVKGSLRWHTQRDRIISDGHMVWGPDRSAARRRQIIIKASEYASWIQPTKRNSTKAFHAADAALVSRLKTILVERSSERPGFRYGFSTIWPVLSPKVSGVFKKTTFKKRVFSGPHGPLLREGASRPSDAERLFFDSIETAIVSDVEAAIFEFQKSSENEE